MIRVDEEFGYLCFDAAALFGVPQAVIKSTLPLLCLHVHSTLRSDRSTLSDTTSNICDQALHEAVSRLGVQVVKPREIELEPE